MTELSARTRLTWKTFILPSIFSKNSIAFQRRYTTSVFRNKFENIIYGHKGANGRKKNELNPIHSFTGELLFIVVIAVVHRHLRQTDTGAVRPSNINIVEFIFALCVRYSLRSSVRYEHRQAQTPSWWRATSVGQWHRENLCHAQSTFSCDFAFGRSRFSNSCAECVRCDCVLALFRHHSNIESSPVCLLSARECQKRVAFPFSHWRSLRRLSSHAPFFVCDTNGKKYGKSTYENEPISGVGLNFVQCFPMVCSLLDGLNSWWRVRELYPPTQTTHSNLKRQYSFGSLSMCIVYSLRRPLSEWFLKFQREKTETIVKRIETFWPES